MGSSYVCSRTMDKRDDRVALEARAVYGLECCLPLLEQVGWYVVVKGASQVSWWHSSTDLGGTEAYSDFIERPVWTVPWNVVSG